MLNLRRDQLKKWRGIDNEFILKNWTQISKRRAKKINPFLFRGVHIAEAYYTCSKLGPDGCTVYEDRPPVCRGYPHYNHPPELINQMMKNGPEYTEKCTEWTILIPTVQVG